MFRDSGISSEICDQADHDAKNKPRSPRPGNGSGALSFALTRTPHDSKSLTGLRGREQKHGRGLYISALRFTSSPAHWDVG